MKNSITPWETMMTIRTLGVILIGTIGTLGSWGDEWDPGDDTALGSTVLGIPQIEEKIHGPHDLSAADTGDWFQMILHAGNPYRFYTTGEAGTIGELYAADTQTQLARHQPNPFVEPNLNFHIDYTPDVSGTFYLRIQAFDASGESFYLFHYLQVPDLRDPWDPLDNAYADGTLLPAPGPTEQPHGLHSLSRGDLVDWFAVDLVAGETYMFRTDSEANTVGDLYWNHPENRVAGNDNRGANQNFTLLYRAAQTGRYYLRVQLAQPGANAYYELLYRSGSDLLPPGDAWDYNDDIFEGATALGEPQTSVQNHGPHTLSPSDQYDWFAFILTAGYTYEWSAGGTAQAYADLFTDDGVTLAVVSDFGAGFELSQNFIFTPLQTGKYFMRVRNFVETDGNYTLNYRLLHIPSGPVLDQWDPGDDTFTGASPLNTISGVEQMHGMHSLSSADLADWFRISMQTGMNYTFWTSGEADTFATLYAADGVTPVAEADDGGEGYNVLLDYSPESGGVYYLRLRMTDIGATGYYILHYRNDPEPVSAVDGWMEYR